MPSHTKSERAKKKSRGSSHKGNSRPAARMTNANVNTSGRKPRTVVKKAIRKAAAKRRR